MGSEKEFVPPLLFSFVLQLLLKYITMNTQGKQLMVYGNDVNFFRENTCVNAEYI
jgi:hypothetical protein